MIARKVVSCVVWLSVASMFVAQAAWGADEIKSVALAVAGSDFAIVPSSGAVVATDPDSNMVMIYRGAYFDGNRSAKIGLIEVGEKPVNVTHKSLGDRDVVLVICHDDNTLPRPHQSGSHRHRRPRRPLHARPVAGPRGPAATRPRRVSRDSDGNVQRHRSRP